MVAKRAFVKWTFAKSVHLSTKTKRFVMAIHFGLVGPIAKWTSTAFSTWSSFLWNHLTAESTECIAMHRAPISQTSYHHHHHKLNRRAATEAILKLFNCVSHTTIRRRRRRSIHYTIRPRFRAIIMGG